MHHFVTEMCTHVHISVTKWYILGYCLMHCGIREMGSIVPRLRIWCVTFDLRELGFDEDDNMHCCKYICAVIYSR